MKIESRSVFGWGPSAAGYANPKNGIACHYDGNNQSLAKKTHAACRDYWARTRKFHMGSSRGWADIGYSFMVCPHGIVLEGRGLNKQQAAQPGGNSTWYSVTFGSGDAEKPTDAQVKAFRELRSWLRGKGVGSPIKPHSSFISTSCCGGILRGLINNGTLSSGTPSKPFTATSRWPYKGSTLMRLGWHDSEGVKAVQKRLNALGAKPRLAEDGDFGPATEAAVRAYQKRTKGLAVDGVCGPRTWERLFDK
ncbi:MAG: N-acetylmuramoyl-L-alanine amidase family 2 [Streptosporangiaceae bacterium]|nr:N-acetylmuramoyl-L-alanine amidase family 2 [Streptosporangiaceae bacterium]